ncbi:MAG TPA: hypothetical protein VL463_10045 [Kofleriaceae bacterium]|nr:hypothetical protein [Kofleriaceae bacterium]
MGAIACLGIVAALPPLISWRAPAECPPEAEVRAQIVEHAGRDRADGREPYAVVDVSEQDGGYAARIQMRVGGATAAREIRGATCANVADAVSWMIALAWSPRGELAPPPPAVIEPPRPPVTRVPMIDPYASAHVATDVGSLPAADAGLGAALGARRGSIDAELAGTWWPSRFAGANGAGVDVGAIELGVRTCAAIACAGVDVGWLEGHGIGVTDARGASLRIVSLSAGLRWRHALGAAALVIDVGARVPTSRPTFVLDDGTALFRPAPVAARFAIALEFW